MRKLELRRTYLERRQSLSAERHEQLSRGIADCLFREIDLHSIRTLHCYISLGHFGEVQTSIIFDRIWEDLPAILTTAPQVHETTGEIVSRIYGRDTPTVESPWKIPEPTGSEVIAADDLDLVIVPLICFDAAGHRVGYGKGFYDRYLSKCRPDCIKAGLSFFPPVESIDDVHEGDVKLDVCITPEETYRFTSL